LWQSALFIEETRVHRENHRLVASHWHTLYNTNMWNDLTDQLTT
jgi:hypothetical protein